MKKAISLLMAMMIVIFSLVGCSFINVFISGEDEMFNSILAAIEKQDAEALRDLFAPAALQNAEYLDEGIAYVFNLFTGEVIDIEAGGSYGHDELGRGVTTRTNSASFQIYTTTGEYRLTYYVCTENVKHPEQVGLQKLFIGPMGADDAAGYDVHEFFCDEFVPAGIYEPGRYPTGASEYAIEMYQQIVEALDNKDNALLKSLFSKNVQNSAAELDEQIEKAMEYFARPSTYMWDGYDVYASARNNYAVIYADDKRFIETDKGGYWIDYKVCFLNEADPNEVGLMRLVITFDDDWISGDDLDAFEIGVLIPEV